MGDEKIHQKSTRPARTSKLGTLHLSCYCYMPTHFSRSWLEGWWSWRWFFRKKLIWLVHYGKLDENSYLRNGCHWTSQTFGVVFGVCSRPRIQVFDFLTLLVRPIEGSAGSLWEA